MSGPLPMCCAGCRGVARLCVNGADFCGDCAGLVMAAGGGEEGIARLMRYGPGLLRDVLADESRRARREEEK